MINHVHFRSVSKAGLSCRVRQSSAGGNSCFVWQKHADVLDHKTTISVTRVCPVRNTVLNYELHERACVHHCYSADRRPFVLAIIRSERVNDAVLTLILHQYFVAT